MLVLWSCQCIKVGGTFITVYPETTTPGESSHMTSNWNGENNNLLMAMGGAAGGDPLVTKMQSKVIMIRAGKMLTVSWYKRWQNGGGNHGSLVEVDY